MTQQAQMLTDLDCATVEIRTQITALENLLSSLHYRLASKEQLARLITPAFQPNKNN